MWKNEKDKETGKKGKIETESESGAKKNIL
jgi:hypothetical protein